MCRAGIDGAKKRKGSKAHIAVDTLGQLLSVVITPANEYEQEQAQVDELWQVQEITDKTVTVGVQSQGVMVYFPGWNFAHTYGTSTPWQRPHNGGGTARYPTQPGKPTKLSGPLQY